MAMKSVFISALCKRQMGICDMSLLFDTSCSCTGYEQIHVLDAVFAQVARHHAFRPVMFLSRYRTRYVNRNHCFRIGGSVQLSQADTRASKALAPYRTSILTPCDSFLVFIRDVASFAIAQANAPKVYCVPQKLQ